MDYRVYHLSRKEVCRSIALAGLLTVAIAYLFYASWLGIVFFPVFIWFFMKRQKKAGEEQMQLQLAKEFVDTLRSISAALLAGFSIENAWKEAEKEILALYGKRSSSFVIMANQLDASIIDKMIFINPVSFHSMDAMPDQQSKLKQTIINLPLVGTFIYNLLMNPKRIDRQFRFIYYCRPQLISSKTKDAYYEAAHMDNSNGKYLYSSLLGNYMNIDLRHAVKKITKPVSFIISSDIKANYKTAQEYRKLNSNIDITYVSNCKLYPQLENPEKVYQIIENKLSN